MKPLNLKFQRTFQQIVVSIICTVLVIPAPVLVAQSPAIVTDGRTRTTVTSNNAGTVTDVRTDTVKGINAYNSFERFNVPGGNTTNLHVPDAAKNLVNLVHNERSQIDGILNSYKNGQIGGNIFFLNPHGIVIGQGGVVNVGTLHLQTPTTDYMNQLLNARGQVSAVHEQMLFSGNVPISSSGLISVKGKINAVEEIQLTAGNIELDRDAILRAGRQVQVNFGDVVNTQNLNWGNDILVTPEGKIRIVATNDVTIAGQVSADATLGENAGQIEILAGNDINVNAGANISARGVGANSDGGNVVIFADRNSNLAGGAIVDVSARSGKGGFLEFSAVDTVNIQGSGLRSSAGGTILIDPKDILWIAQEGDFSFDKFTNGVEYQLIADDSIVLKNVYISTRDVNDSGLSGEARRQAHLTGASQGDSSDIIIKAATLEMENSFLLAHATGVHNAGNIEITLENNNALLEWGAYSLNNPFASAEAEFTMDAGSLIKGGDVKIDVKAETKLILDFDKLELSEAQSNIFTEAFADTFNDIIGGLLGDINGKLPQGKKSAKTIIEIDGDIIATTGNIDINATASASAEFKKGGKGVVWSNAQVFADSQILIGGQANIRAVDGDVTMLSTANTTIKIEGEEEDRTNIPLTKIPFPLDIAIALGYAESINKIDIADGANITAGGDISIEALTERSHELSVSGGSGQSYMALVVGILIGNAQTDVIVNGALNAGRDVVLSAKTETEENSVSTIAKMQDTDDPKWEGLADFAKDEIQKSVKGLFTSAQDNGNTNTGLFDQFGAAGAVSFTDDNVITKIIVGKTANISAGNNVEISAKTVNQVASSAFSMIGAYEVNNKEVNNDIAIAVSTPIVIMNNSTTVFVEAKEITAGGAIDVIAETKIPFNATHPIYDLMKLINGSDDVNPILFVDDLATYLAQGFSGSKGAFGFADGLLNTWGQSSAQTDKFGGAAMVTVLNIENTTVAQIAGGIINASDLNVDAKTTVELANLVGSLASITPAGDLPDIKYIYKNHGPEAFKDIYGAGSSSAGGALLYSNIDSTTIARIDGGTITLSGDLDVKAETKSVDIGIALGAGKSGTFGLDLMANLSFYDSYTLAKIDDAVKVIAKNVSIAADDAAYRIGITGSLTSSSQTSIGISGTSSVMLRDAHAVWGNLLNADGTLATIKGDNNPEKDYTAEVVESEVTEKITIESNLHGINLIASVAGSGTGTTEADEKRKEYLADENVQRMRNVHENNRNRIEEVEKQLNRSQFGLSGAVVVSYMNENSSAGISGNVNITAGDIKIDASNSIFDVTIGGAGVLQTGQGSNTGIAGGIAVNVLDGNTVAYIQPYIEPDTKTVVAYETLDINATRTGNIISAAAGAAVSSSSKGAEVGGSVTFNFLDDDTFVRIHDANLQKKNSGTGDIIAMATNSAGIYSLAGGLAVGGSTSIGASAAYNYLGLNTYANISNSIITANDLTLLSGNQSSIVTIALGGGVGNGTAVGGTIAVVISDSNTAIGIEDSVITLDGYIKADALSQSAIGARSYYDAVVKAIQKEDDSKADYTNSKGFDLGEFDPDNLNKYDAPKTNPKDKPNDYKAMNTVDENGDKDGTLAEKEVLGQADLGLAGHSPKIVTAALAVGAGKGNGVAVGANIAVNILTDTTSTNITGSTIKSGRDAQYTAETNGGIIAVGIGVAGSTSGVAVSGNVGVNIIGGGTSVNMINNNELTSAKNFGAQAKNESGIIGIGVNIAGTGGAAGVGVSAAYNQIAHGTEVLVDNTTITGSTVDLEALNESSLVSVLLSVGAGRTAGVGASFAINTIGSLSGSEISKNDMDEIKIDEAKDKDGNQRKTAESSRDIKDEDGNSIGEDKIRSDIATQFGLQSTTDSKNVLEKIGESENVTQVVITKDSKVEATQGDIGLSAQNSGGILSIAIGAGFGGTAGVGAAFAYNNISSATGIVTDGTGTANGVRIVSAADLTAQSDSTNRIIAVSIGMGGGGTAGVGAGVAVNNLSGTNQVSFTNTTTTAQNDISLHAHNGGKIISVTGGLAGGGTAGVGASVGVNLLKGNTTASIVGGTTTSKNNAVSVEATNTANIVSVAVAGAGGGVAGISGAVAVNLIRGTTTARIGSLDQNETIINSKTGVNIDAISSGEIVSVAVAAAGAGAAAVSIDVAVNIIKGTTGAYLENTPSSLPKQQNDVSTDGSLHMLANSNHDIRSTIVGLSGAGVAAVNVLVGSNTIKGITEAVVKNSVVHAGKIDIMANNESRSLGVSVSGAGAGVAAVSVQTDVHVLTQAVKTIIESSELYAKSGKLQIDAIDEKSVNANTIGIGGAAVAAVGGAVSVIVVDGTNRVDVMDSTLQAKKDLIVNAASTTTLQQISGVLAGAGIAGVGVAVGVNVFEQKTFVTIAGSMLESLSGDIDIIGKGTTNIARMQGHSVGAGGIAGVAGTVFVTNVDDETKVAIGNYATDKDGKFILEDKGESSLTATQGNVDILSESNFKQGNTVVGGAGIGGIAGVGAGVNVLTVRNGAALITNSDITARDIYLDSKLTRNVATSTYAGGGGLVGLAATVSVISMGGKKFDINSTVDDKDGLKALTGGVDKASKMSGNYADVSSWNSDVVNNSNEVSGSAVLSIGGTLNATGFVDDTKYFNIGNITASATAENTVNQKVYGFAAGLGAAGAAVGVLNLNDDVKITVKDGANLKANAIDFDANVKEKGIDLYVVTGALGAVAGGAAVANAKINLDSTVALGAANLRTDTLSVKADGEQNVLVNSVADIAGGVGIMYPSSKVTVNENNTITLNGTYIDAWGTSDAVKFIAGNYANDNVSATAYLYNYTALPLSLAAGANAYMNQKDAITFGSGTYVGSVGDIIVETGVGSKTANVVGYSEATSIYQEICQFFSGSSCAIIGGNGSKGFSADSTITFAGAILEAGSHWDTKIIIDDTGEIDRVNTSGWVVDMVGKNPNTTVRANALDVFKGMIQSLEDKINQQKKLGGSTEAFELEIKNLEAQLKYYLIDDKIDLRDTTNLIASNFKELVFVNITGDIVASAGDIRLDAAKLISIGDAETNTLTARRDPSITIVNNSFNSLDLAKLNLEIPYRLGGRVILNSMIVDNNKKNDIGLTNATLDSIGNSVSDTPKIIVNNPNGGDLFVRGGSFIRNPNGSVEILSKGSIWMSDSVVSGKDITIKTEGSFYQGYQDGLYSTAGNPLGVGTEAYTLIQDWINEQLLFGGMDRGTAERKRLDAANELKDYVSNWNEVFNSDGSIKSGKTLDNLKPSGSFASDWETLEPQLYAARNVANSDYESALGTAAGMTLDEDNYDTVLDEVFGSGASGKLNDPNSDGLSLIIVFANTAVNNAEITMTSSLATWKAESEKLKGLIATGTPTYDSNGIISNISALTFTGDNNASAFNAAQNSYNDAVVDHNNKINLQNKISDLNSANEKYAAANKTYSDALDVFSGKIGIYSRMDVAVEFAKSDGNTSKTLQKAATDYADAVNNLQSLSTTDSWIIVFGQGGSENLNDLIDKTTGKPLLESNQTVIDKYTEFKGNYNAEMTKAATDYLKRNVKSYADISNGLVDSVDRTSTDIWSLNNGALNASVDSVIYGGRSVYISAEILNVNGLIKSGVLDHKIDLSDIGDVIAGALNGQDISSKVYGGAIDDKNNVNFGKPKVTVVVDNSGNRNVEIENVQANAGNVTLYGNIISTGNGTVEVSDGYGRIDIIGNPNYDLVLNRVDAGLDSEGQIRIVDTAFRNENGQSQNTVYTRAYENGTNVLYMQTGYGDQLGEKQFVSTTSIGQYETKEDRWLETFSGNKYTLTVNYAYVQKVGVAFGAEVDWLAKDRGNELRNVSGNGSVARLPSGTYLMDINELAANDARRSDNNFNSNNLLIGVFTRTSEKATVTPQGISRTADDTFLGFGTRTYDRFFRQTQVYTDKFETYMNASRPIDISFVGSQDINHSNVNITGAKSVTINDLVRSANTVTIEATGDITTGIKAGGFGSVDAKVVELASTNGGNISGHDGYFSLETVLGGTTLTATTSGNVNLNAIGNDLIVEKITGNNVDIITSSDILQAKPGVGIVAGNDLTLVSGGRIGNVNGSVKSGVNPEKLDRNQMFNFQVENNTSIEAIGQIDAYFDKTDGKNDRGNLYVDTIVSTAGDVNLYVTGDILDRNDFVQDDPNGDLFRLNMWNELGLMDSVDKKQENAIKDLERTRTMDYFAVWLSVYDNFDNLDGYDTVAREFRFNEEAKANLQESGWTAKEIADEESKRTKAYRETFDNASGFQKEALSKAFDAEYAYTATEQEKEDLRPIGTWKEEELLNQLTGVLFADAGTRMDTTSTIEAANISGKDITIYSGGAIGESTGNPITIDSSVGGNLWLLGVTQKELDALTPEQREEREEIRRALADAEWDDLKFFNGDDEIKQQDFDKLADFFNDLEMIEIKRYDNINITATGTLKTYSEGWTNIGSQNDIEIGNGVDGSGIVANGTNDSDQSLRLKTDGSIYATDTDSVAIKAKNAVLEAAGGVLGGRTVVGEDEEVVIVDTPLIVNLTGGTDADGWITARGADGVYLSFVDDSGNDADAYLREIGSWREVNLTAATLANALPDTGAAKIGGKDIVLTATGIDEFGNSIGSKDSFLWIAQAIGGSLTVDAVGDVFLYNTTASLDIKEIVAQQNVEIGARGNISLSDAELDIKGNATFVSDTGTIVMVGGYIVVGGDWRVKGEDISLADTKITVAGDLIKTADNISIKHSIIDVARNTSLTATNGNLTLTDLVLNSAGILDMTATNNIWATNSNIEAGDTTLTATGGDLKIAGGKANFGNALLTSGNDISVTDWMMAAIGTLDATAANNFSATDSRITAGNTNLTATNGSLDVNGGSAGLGNTRLAAGRNIAVTDWVLNAAGTLGATAANNFSATDSRITAGNTNLTATNGSLDVNGGSAGLGNARLASGNNISVADWVLNSAGTLDMSAAKNVTSTDSSITAGDTALTATGGDLKIAGGAANLDSALLTSGKDISVTDWTLKDTGTLGMTAANNIVATDSNITAGNTALTATGGNLTVAGGAANLGSALLTSGKDISVTDWTLKDTGTLGMTAANNIAANYSNITAGDTKLTATGGDLKITGGTANLGSALLASGNDISATDWTLNNAGALGMTAANNIAANYSNITAGNTALTATGGDLKIAGGAANLGNALLASGNDISATDWTLNGTGTLGMTAANNITANDSNITAGDTALTATDGDLTITGGAANLGNALLTSGNDISVTDWTVNGTGTLDMTAANNIAATNSNIEAGDTALTATDGDLTITGGTANLGNALLASGNDISVTDWTLNGAGTLDMTAANNIVAKDSSIEAGDTALTAANGNLTITGGMAGLGDTRLTAGDNISLTDWTLTALGSLDATAANDIVVTGSHIEAGDTTLTATAGDLIFTNGTARLGNAFLTAGKDITLADSRFDIEGYFDINAADHLTLKNFVATAQTANLKASRYTLSNWHIYANELWIDGGEKIDIFNDPRFKNLLAYDRIVNTCKPDDGIAIVNTCIKSDGEEIDAPVISGGWLSLGSEPNDNPVSENRVIF